MIAVAEPPATKPRPEERIEQLFRTISASRLGCGHQCRLKFYFRYILQIPKAPTPSRHSGSVCRAKGTVGDYPIPQRIPKWESRSAR